MQQVKGFIGTIWLLLATILTFGQVPEFSQFFAAPVHLNPALAGTNYEPRLSLNYRNQWPGFGAGISGGFVTYQVSYDQHIEAIKGGVGISLLTDRIAQGSLNTNQAVLTYAPQIRISRKIGIKFALSAMYHNRQINWDKITERDRNNTLLQYGQTVRVGELPQESPFGNQQMHAFDAGFGALLFSARNYVGLAVQNVLGRQLGFGGDASPNQLKITLHGGSTFFFDRRKTKYIVPQLMIVNQRLSTQLLVGSIMNYKYLHGGLYYRHTFSTADDVILMAGFKKGKIRVGYSVDIPLGKLSGTSSKGSHEISMSIFFRGEDNSISPRARSGILPCPDILRY